MDIETLRNDFNHIMKDPDHTIRPFTYLCVGVLLMTIWPIVLFLLGWYLVFGDLGKQYESTHDKNFSSM